LLKTFTVSAINKKILSGNLLSCNGVFIRREDFLNNLFCEDRKMASLEDWELWIRLAAKFNFDYHHAVTSAIVNHLDRSVMTVNKERIKTKVDLFIDKVMNNPHNQLSYGKRLQWAQASALTYAALHLSLAKEKKTVVINYLWKAILISPREIFKKRFLVIIKNLVLPYSVH
ncbi:MAG: hypothetical protein JST43_10540, partial [Bacteroidetes bacterium]|nr:hypothetical protein [Bacteroidota bacterium]